jgi:hypothetical protein
MTTTDRHSACNERPNAAGSASRSYPHISKLEITNILMGGILVSAVLRKNAHQRLAVIGKNPARGSSDAF